MHLTSKIKKIICTFILYDTSVTPVLLHVLQQRAISESLEAAVSPSDASFCRDGLGKRDCNISKGKCSVKNLSDAFFYYLFDFIFCCSFRAGVAGFFFLGSIPFDLLCLPFSAPSRLSEVWQSIRPTENLKGRASNKGLRHFPEWLPNL